VLISRKPNLCRRFIPALAAVAALCTAVSMAWAAPRDPYSVAVIIGNRTYQNDRVPEVSYAHRDAAAFRQYVIEVLGFDPDNIIDLRDASQAAMESTFGNERRQQGKLWSYLDPEGASDVVVFYSGHGVPGLHDKRGYLLPVDADPDTAEINGYPIDLLYTNLGRLTEARSVRVFLDACFSGDSHKGMLLQRASPVFVRAEIKEDTGNLTVLAATSGDQVASWDENAEHGLFTHHLLDALYGKGDKNGDGTVTVAETKAYLDRHMTRAARRTYLREQTVTSSGRREVAPAVARDGAFPARPEVSSGASGPATAALTVDADEMDAVMVTNDRSNVRAGPGTSFDVVARLDPGAEVTVTGRVKNKNWYRIALSDGRTAYVFSKLLSEPSETPAKSETTVAARSEPPPPPPALTVDDMQGTWRGYYRYSPRSSNAPVEFVLRLKVQDGAVTGTTVEPRTFGKGPSEYLYANIRGQVTPEGRLSFTKSYDGTGGVSHSVKYTGWLDLDARRITGEWVISSTRGSFDLAFVE